MATATAPVPRELLEDRYEGLVNGPDDSIVQAVDTVLWQLVEGVSRTPREFDGWQEHPVIDELHRRLRASVVELVEAAGIAE